MARLGDALVHGPAPPHQEGDPQLPPEEGDQGILLHSQRQMVWARLRRDKAAIAAAVMLIAIVIFAAVAPLISRLTGHGPNQLFPSTLTGPLGLPSGPSAHFFFGVDQVGRDLFVRVAYGARTSLFVGVVGTLFADVIGITLGSIAGFYGGRIDTVLSRVFDVFLSLPLILFAIGISSVCSATATGCLWGLLKPGVSMVIGIITLFMWAYLARIVRGQVLSLRRSEFCAAAISVGSGNFRLMFSEILPNLFGPILVFTTLAIPTNILFAADLAFLGLGVNQSTPDWGRMLSDAASGGLFTYAWWMMLFAGVFLIVTMLSFNILGDGVADALDPRERM